VAASSVAKENKGGVNQQRKENKHRKRRQPRRKKINNENMKSESGRMT